MTRASRQPLFRLGFKLPTFTLRQLMTGMLMISIGLALGWYLSEWVLKARRDAAASAAQSPFNQIMVALATYHDAHGCFPPAYIADANGRPMHSWRVLILPHLGEQALYNQYRFDEPWNGPHNSRLQHRMPRIFRSPTEPAADSNQPLGVGRFTNLVVIVGPDTAFPGDRSTKLADFKDGPENCILLTEITNSDICWTEPRDLDAATMSFRPNDPAKPSISAVPWRQPYVTFADRISAVPVSPETPPEVLQALTTISGSEAFTREDLQAPKKPSRANASEKRR